MGNSFGGKGFGSRRGSHDGWKPWKDLRVEQQRLLLIQDHEEGALISELSGIYVGSRKTIYKWLERHEEEGIVGLKDRSRRPHESPHQVSAAVEQAIVEARQR